MKKSFKLLLLCLPMMFILFVGCALESNAPATPIATPGTPVAQAQGQSAQAQVPQTQEPQIENVVLHAIFSGNPPNDEDYVLAEVNRRLAEDGYNFSIRTSFVGDFWTNLPLMVLAGETIDIAMANARTLADLTARGVYHALDPYFDIYAPYLSSIIPEHTRAQGTVGGVLHAVPRAVPSAQFNQMLNIRGDLREEWGLPEVVCINTLDAFMRRANEESMFSTIGEAALLPVFGNYFFPLFNLTLFVDPNDPTFTVQTWHDSPGFRGLANTVRQWMLDGIIPEDVSVIGGNASQAFLHGHTATITGNLQSQAERTDPMFANVPEARIEAVLLNPIPRYVFVGGDNMLGVPTTSDNIREALQFMNWIRLSQDNFDLWTHGVYGRNFELTDTGAITFENIPPEMRYVPRVWNWNDTAMARFSEHMPLEDVERLRRWDEYAVVTPFVGFVLDMENIRTEYAQLNAIRDEFSPMITGGLVDIDDVLDEFLRQMRSSGLQRVVDEVQRQLNEFLGQ